MANLRVTVRLPPRTGIERDAVYNSFAFISNAATTLATNYANILLLMNDFYNGNPVGINPINQYLSSFILRTPTQCQVKIYNIGAPPQAPVFTGVFTLGIVSLGANDLPNEVASTLSHSALLTGVSEGLGGGPRARQRRRGRMYIGPLTTQAMTKDPVTGIMKPEGNFVNTMLNAADRLANPAVGNPDWCVWSRSDNLLRPVVSWWVKDVFDVQRRRGTKLTSKTRGGLLQ